MSSTPDKRRVEFADELRFLRIGAGLNGKEFADRLGWHPSKVSKIENNRQDPTDADVAAWLDAVEAPAPVATRMRDELRGMRIETNSWKNRLRKGHGDRQRYSVEVEGAATRIRAFELMVVPGLVQIAEYARHVFVTAAELQETPPDTDEAVRIRLERQRVLYDSTKSIELLMCESALRYFVCPPDVMLAQIDRLLALIGLAAVRFGIIPLDTVLPSVPTNGFWIVGHRVLVETVDSEIDTDSPVDLATYHKLADSLWTVAAEGDDARRVLMRCAAAIAEKYDLNHKR
ncbi:helix-turn-helix transcriptional regulator [Saccharothrix violaceirubra]|uniref:Transcriptional regulator with XRE-family HTH domain n=1 Tax=Saccharothrix violaceirubra TaxID=413306 RepID=A0A7W7T6B5_9PSEU|nr:helix-turn-helix transcriptional regulator [Saccharothrix violaceirubra]MBB4967345.1 transcriptional regulator with XRE-family HTH domain [Saccharothrix violaceirubra]